MEVVRIVDHRPPCARCLNIAHHAAMHAVRYNDARWRVYAAETWLGAYEHSTAVCHNPNSVPQTG